MPAEGRVRPKVVGLFRKDDEVLVLPAIDPATGEDFIGLPGGGA